MGEDVNKLENIDISLSMTDDFQNLCLMCGQCCRIIVPAVPYSKLMELANQNEEEAKDFVNTFQKYNTIEDARKVNAEHVDKIINSLTKNSQIPIDDIAIYYCPHVSDTNTCKIYSNRPNCCRRAPSNCWALFPSNCGYEGWQFDEREKVKANIRRLKEQLYEIKVLYSDSQDENVKNKIAGLEQKVEEKIKPYIKYGAQDW